MPFGIGRGKLEGSERKDRIWRSLITYTWEYAVVQLVEYRDHLRDELRWGNKECYDSLAWGKCRIDIQSKQPEENKGQNYICMGLDRQHQVLGKLILEATPATENLWIAVMRCFERRYFTHLLRYRPLSVLLPHHKGSDSRNWTS